MPNPDQRPGPCRAAEHAITNGFIAGFAGVAAYALARTLEPHVLPDEYATYQTTHNQIRTGEATLLTDRSLQRLSDEPPYNMFPYDETKITQEITATEQRIAPLYAERDNAAQQLHIYEATFTGASMLTALFVRTLHQTYAAHKTRRNNPGAGKPETAL